MAQFDVYRVGDALILHCQSDLLSALPTRFTVPLEPRATAPAGLTRFNPISDLAGEPVMMLTEYAGAVPRTSLRIPIGSLAGGDAEDQIKRALDMLVSGI